MKRNEKNVRCAVVKMLGCLWITVYKNKYNNQMQIIKN